MKLRNKKTGEIIEAESLSIDTPTEGIVGVPSFDRKGNYNSLAELNEEWCDYEEPKEYWFIDYDGGIILCDESDGSSAEKMMKSIGNYFVSLEEAEKAVEKLKAWKQLKDNCNFRFNGFERDERGRLISVKVEFDNAQVTFDTAKRCYEILHLLFGGEE